MHPKDVKGLANSVDSDQTAPVWSGSTPKDIKAMANSIDPDQTAPIRAVWSGSTLFAHPYLSQNFYGNFH